MAPGRARSQITAIPPGRSTPDRSRCLSIGSQYRRLSGVPRRLIWLADIARLVRLTLDWTEAFDLAVHARCARPVLLGLLLAHDVLDAGSPDALLDRARADRSVTAAAAHVTSYLRRTVLAHPTTMELTRFNARLAEAPWDKVRHYAALLRAPAEPDLALVSLPPALFPLYYPVRFARLAAKYVPQVFRHRAD